MRPTHGLVLFLAVGLLAAAAMSAAPPTRLMDWPDLLSRPRPKATETIRWGPGRAQFAQLWLPVGPGPHPVVLMIHGGCWQSKIANLSIMDWAAEDLRRRGLAVWNIEYRGIDEPGGGWPGTFVDAAGSADALRDNARRYNLEVSRIVAFGHSAGGHLALWLAGRPRLARSSPLWSARPLTIAAVVSSGGLPDLEADRAAKDAACGAKAVDRLVGEPSAERPDVFADTSPARLLPLAVEQWIAVSDQDPVSPPWLARDWADKVKSAGDRVEMTVFPRSGHAELIAPGLAAWSAEAKMIERLVSGTAARPMTAPLPDAHPANWVDRLAPEPLRPWLKLGRFDRPTGIWLLLLPAWQGIALACAERCKWPSWRLLALFALGAALMRAAGCAYNDIVDKEIDAKVARTAARPVASGRISVAAAWAFIAACGVASFMILVSLNTLSFVLGVASLALVAAYPFMKRITWWPQAWLGLTFNWGALMGFAAAGGGASAAQVFAGANPKISLPGLSLAALLLYACDVCWTLGYDTIYAVQDLEDDALAGVKSSARRLGQAAPAAVMVFYLASAALAVSAWKAGGLGVGFLPFVALFAGQLVWQALRLRIDRPAAALALFKSNTLAGLLLLAGLVAGHWRVYAA